MRLNELIAQYVAFRKNLGQDFEVIGSVWPSSLVLSEKVSRSTVSNHLKWQRFSPRASPAAATAI
jgi:hypothetical protein